MSSAPTASTFPTRWGGPKTARRWALVVGAVGIGTLGAGLVLNYLDIHVASSGTFWRALLAEGARLFYADAEGNAWSWLSALVLAGLAAALAVKATAVRTERGLARRYWVLAGLALILSMDEGAQLHEFLNQVGYRVTDDLGPFNAWLIPGVVVLVVVGALLLWLARGIDPVLRRWLVVAGAVFIAGAVGMEAVGAAFALSSELPNPWLTGRYHLLVGAEEGLEMLGVLIALWATVSRTSVAVPADSPVVTVAPA